MREVKHTPGPWTMETVRTSAGVCFKVGPFPYKRGQLNHACIYADYPSSKEHAECEANACLIAAAPELLWVAANFEITGPDDDGLVWLVLHGNGTTGKAMFNLGSSDGIASQVALHLEVDRRAAIAKATGSAS